MKYAEYGMKYAEYADSEYDKKYEEYVHCDIANMQNMVYDMHWQNMLFNMQNMQKYM